MLAEPERLPLLFGNRYCSAWTEILVISERKVEAVWFWMEKICLYRFIP